LEEWTKVQFTLASGLAQTSPMRTAKTFAILGLASALLPVPLSAALPGPNDFAETLAQLSDADREAMDRARIEVLTKMQQGAVSNWKDDRTGHSGEVRIARTYERNGLMCAEVDHFLKLTRESRYVIPFCRDASGAWRAAF
jgi:surface antigen